MIMEPSWDATQSASCASKADIIAQNTPLTCSATVTGTGRNMGMPHSSSNIDTQEKSEQYKSVAEVHKNLSTERGEDGTNLINSGLSLNRSSAVCQDGFKNFQLFEECDVHSRCNEHVDIVSDNVEFADRLTSEDEVTLDPPQVAGSEKETPFLSLSPRLEMGNSEELEGKRKIENHSLNDSSEKDGYTQLPNKSSVPRFVYGICNTSTFKRRKKEAAKSQMGRKSSRVSSSFKKEELADEKCDWFSVSDSVNGHQSASGNHGKIVEHNSFRSQGQKDTSLPILTSKSSKVDRNDETTASQIGRKNASVPLELSLQDEALDLTNIHCKKDVPASRTGADQDAEHISYIAEFDEEVESSSTGGGEQGLEKSSKKGFLSITGLIQKRRTPMMKRYKMKDVVPETRDEDESATKRHLGGELKGAASHPMIKYYRKIQRDSQSIRPSKVDVANIVGDSSREVEDAVSDAGPLEQCSTERTPVGMSNSEESKAIHPMVKYYQLMQGLSQTPVESDEEFPQDEGDASSTTQEKERIPSIRSAVIHTENDPIKRFKCKVCGRAFRHSQGLTAHKKIHSNERPFSCQHCDLKFRVKQNLITHVRTHTGEKPHSCEVCGRGFGQQSTLVRHLRSHTGEKPYTCEYCQRKFSQRHVMMNHVRIHTGEKPYSCKVCGKDFKEQHNLVRHVRTHTGEKPYACQECGNKFTQKNHLMRHAKVHIPKKHTI